MGVGADLRIKDYLAKVCRSELGTRQPDVTLPQEENQASICIKNQNRLPETPPDWREELSSDRNSHVCFKLVTVHSDFSSALGLALLKLCFSL